MKKIMILAVMFLMSASFVLASPESKLEKMFSEAFPNAQAVKWHADATGFLVSFKEGETLTKISYDKKGNFLCSLRYYGEKDLPTNILLAIKNKYKGKDIFGVTEYTTNSQVEYHIKLYDGQNWYSIKASNGSNIQDEDAPDTDDNDN